MQDQRPNPAVRRIPLAVKLLFTAFMMVLVPVYWANYGVTNFLYFCDIALFLTLVAVWRESALLASIAAVGILLPQIGWCVDYACGWFGVFPLGLTAYMFDADSSLFLRGLSTFHGWLPFLLLYIVVRVGYDRRAFRWWWGIAWSAMFIAFFTLPNAKNEAEPLLPYNVNYVYGLDEPQTAMHPYAWFVMMLFVVTLGMAGPTHLFLRRFWRAN